MCRLLAIRANKPVKATFSLIGANYSLKEMVDSREQTFRNIHGWGIGFKDDYGQLIVDKNHISAKDDPLFTSNAKQFFSSLFISHVRYGPNPSYENTHPFQQGKWIFAHNGKVDMLLLEKLLSTPINAHGSTDSELLFLLILKEYNKTSNMVEAISSTVKAIREHEQSYSSLNFLMTNGSDLYAYKEKSPVDKGHHELYWLFRDPEKRVQQYSSSEIALLYEDKFSKGEKAVIIASEEMTKGEKWISFENKQLMVINQNLEVDFYKLM